MNIEEKDRIGQYLKVQLSEIVFDELSDAYLEKAGIADILSGVPVPLRKSELGKISTLTIAKCMAFVIGCDPEFKYKENYIAYINRTFEVRFAEALIAEGVETAANGSHVYAAALFRAAMLLEPGNANAYYCYGRACKDIYEEAAQGELSEETEELIGRFKAEALEAFEVATLKNPKLADAYYFLGYAYLNMGLYIKAKLTWDEYLKLAEEMPTSQEKKELIEEIAGRLASLEKPVEIEKGYNLIISGRYEEGIAVLEKYREGEFASWWPLWFYLGTAYGELGETDMAISCYKEALKYSPSNIECMTNLVNLYNKMGDKENSDKYSKKIAIVKENIEKDRHQWKKKEQVQTKLN